jgi:hypothetical protein
MMQRLEFSEDQLCQWAGMGDFVLVSPDRKHSVELMYEGEPPHGDSYHRVAINGHVFPGYAWGCWFGFSPCSRFLAFSAMPTKFERHTMVVDLLDRRYFVLPTYIYQFRICWPEIIGEGRISEGRSYQFGGNEQWLAY